MFNNTKKKDVVVTHTHMTTTTTKDIMDTITKVENNNQMIVMNYMIRL
jgi:hypothetical protein